MSAAQCHHQWEAEAVRDNRLPAAERLAHELHAQHCPRCTHEREQLERLASTLQAVAPHPGDDLSLRRERQRVLESFNAQTLGAAPSGRYARWGLGLVAAAVLLVALGSFVQRKRVARAPLAARQPSVAPAELSSLRLVASSGSRFDQQRRAGLDSVTLHEGTLSIDFDRGPHADLLVRVPDGEIRDLGTVFRVTVSAGHTVEISVQEGAVVFRRPGEADVIVLAGEVFQRPEALEPAPSEPEASMPSAIRAPRSHRSAGPPRAKATPSAAAALDAPHTPELGAAQEDAAYLHIVELLEVGQRHEAGRAARVYLSEFPDGFRRNEVQRIASAE
jgi:ferric-dicitrate binding protein FerR (iron transport regulator)